ncbi:cilia- and flagella-associated protein 263-like [Mytilus galloprovincialis]|uniref:Cilia- and flagella-associated protein 263 n=1 Tax=Mytilus galloprovincialis TaxID=29158 RepID=A0A8B6G7C8_MYTGA|nr:Hypothetical predicted protein [Mytilus galloprovincialis]
MADSESMSLDTSNEAGDDPLMDLNDEQLDKLIQQKMIENQVLQNETQMFEKYLKKSEPKDSGGALGGIGAGLTVSSSNQDLSRGMNRKRSKSRGANLDKSLRLTTEQKCDIAQKELDDLKEDIEKYRDNCERVIDNFRAIMEECELTLSETKKESYEFERDILKGAVNQRTGKVIAEKVSRHFENKILSRDTLVEKLRLKNSQLKVQKMKLDLQFKQKEEMGEALHEVDFQQLKIENEQYLEKIDEKNTELMDLKLKASKSLQVLNSYKKKLHTLTMESERLKSEISSRNELLTKIDAETTVVEDERAKAEKINRKLRQQLTDFRVPDVMDYVTEKADLYEIQRKVKNWERKVEIAEMALKTHKKMWTKMQIGSEMANQQWRMMEQGVM